MSPYAQHALALVAGGYSPVPIKSGSQAPSLWRWQARCTAAPSAHDIEQDRRRWPRAGLGVACGYRGLVGIDIDTDNFDIVAAIELALQDCGGLSPVGKIGRKGRTLLYRCDGLRSRSFNDRAGQRVLDILAAGRQTVIPPTIHPKTGRPYAWELADHTLLIAAVDELPELTDDADLAIEEALRPWMPEPPPVAPAMHPAPPGAPVDDQERYRLTRWIEAKLRARCAELAVMPANSGRNDATFRLACAAGAFVHHGLLSASELQTAILQACERNGLAREDGKAAVLATIRSALMKSRGDPLPVLRERAA